MPITPGALCDGAAGNAAPSGLAAVFVIATAEFGTVAVQSENQNREANRPHL